MNSIKPIWRALAFFTPHFYTTLAAFEQDRHGEWQPICPVSRLQPWEYYRKVGKVRVFKWLGFELVFQREASLSDFRGRYGDTD